MSESPNDTGESPYTYRDTNKYNSRNKPTYTHGGESPNDTGESPNHNPPKRKY